MNKTDWNDYKKNNIKLIWRNAEFGWCKTLPFKQPLIEFIKKFSPEKIHYKLLKTRFKLIRKPIMPTCEYVVTTKCTMNCKHCNTFVPYFSNKTHAKPVTFEQFKKDIDTLLRAVDYIDYFGLVGGEPLITPDIDKMIKYAISKRKIRHLFVATNCTILPNEKILKAMQNKKAAFQLSDYRDVKFKNNTTIKYSEMKELLAKNNVKFSHPQEDMDRMTFQSMPELYPDKQDEKKVKEMFECCWGQYCNMLCDGILSQCTLSVYIVRNLELTDEVKEEIVNIREKKSSRQLANEIIKFYAKPYSALCHYCHKENVQRGLPCGEQL